MTAKDKLIEKLKEYLELLKNSLIYGECPLDADYANSLIKEISALESEIKEKDEPKMSAESYPDTEADGYVFCGKCGKMKDC